jgi:hypothetical protein
MTDVSIETAVNFAAANPPVVLAILATAAACGWITKLLTEE